MNEKFYNLYSKYSGILTESNVDFDQTLIVALFHDIAKAHLDSKLKNKSSNSENISNEQPTPHPYTFEEMMFGTNRIITGDSI